MKSSHQALSIDVKLAEKHAISVMTKKRLMKVSVRAALQSEQVDARYANISDVVIS